MPKHTGSAQVSTGFLISKHAARRMAQRSISSQDAEALLWYGDAAPAGRGASLLKIGENQLATFCKKGFDRRTSTGCAGSRQYSQATGRWSP